MTVDSALVSADGLLRCYKGGYLTIVNVVQSRMGVVGVIHDHGPAETVAILSGQMAVVPERTRLIDRRKIVGKRITGGNWALVHEGSAVRPIGALLENTMKMLRTLMFKVG